MPSFDPRAARRTVFLLSSLLCLSGCVAAIPLAQMAMTPGFGAQPCSSAETPVGGQGLASGGTANCNASPLAAMFGGLGQSMRSLTGATPPSR